MQDCLFPDLGIVRNMKPTDVFFLYSIPEKAYGLRHIDGKTRTCLVMSQCFQQYHQYEIRANTKLNLLICLLPI